MTKPVPPDQRPVPQPVLSPLTGAAIFLVLSINPGGEPAARDLLPDLAGLARSVGSRGPEAALTCVAGVGSAAWDRLFSGARPAGLHPFRELDGAKYNAIATPGDLLFHIRAKQMDLCFELAAQIMNRLTGCVTADDEVHGFRYFDERNLLGFVAGTENPSGHAAVTAGSEDPRFAGGCYAVVQKYTHDMRAWNSLATSEQEKVIGRTKFANIELPDAIRPANSHVAVTARTGADGTDRQVLRGYMPFGSAGRGEFGTYFIGYAAASGVIEQMLTDMFIGNPPGNYDRILDYSTPVTGGLFFVPSAGFLADPPAPPAGSTATRQPAGLSANGTGARLGDHGGHSQGHTGWGEPISYDLHHKRREQLR
jgi:porphyrinogen peroxidase